MSWIVQQHTHFPDVFFFTFSEPFTLLHLHHILYSSKDCTVLRALFRYGNS